MPRANRITPPRGITLSCLHVRQDILREAGNSLGTREVGEAELEVMEAGGFAVLEGLDQLVRGSVDRAVFGLLLGIGDGDTRHHRR